MDEPTLDLLEAGYWAAEYRERDGRQLLLTVLDGEVARAAELDAETPGHQAAVSALLDSGAVEIPAVIDQGGRGPRSTRSRRMEKRCCVKRADSLRTAAQPQSYSTRTMQTEPPLTSAQCFADALSLGPGEAAPLHKTATNGIHREGQP